MNWETVRNKLIELISTDGIKAMLDTFNAGSSTYSAIFWGKKIPEAYQDLNDTILIYRVSPIGPGEIVEYSFSIQCRRNTEYSAERLAGAVAAALNRVEATVTGGRVLFQANILESIFEDENCWNVPVEISARNNL